MWVGTPFKKERLSEPKEQTSVPTILTIKSLNSRNLNSSLNSNRMLELSTIILYRYIEGMIMNKV